MIQSLDRNTGDISVIIPVYNHGNYLGQALESVLGQSYSVSEIIVVDDGSTDDSVAVAKKFSGVTVLKKAHGGIAMARNAGLQQARGAFIAFLDADDLWHRDKLKLQMEVLGRDTDLDMVFAHVRQFFSPDLNELERGKNKIDREIISGCIAGTLLAHRKCFETVGFFSEELRSGEFIDWYARAQDAGLRDRILPEVLYERRIHSTNHGIRERHSRSDYFRVLKDSIDRRRQQKSSEL